MGNTLIMGSVHIQFTVTQQQRNGNPKNLYELLFSPFSYSESVKISSSMKKMSHQKEVITQSLNSTTVQIFVSLICKPLMSFSFKQLHISAQIWHLGYDDLFFLFPVPPLNCQLQATTQYLDHSNQHCNNAM